MVELLLATAASLRAWQHWSVQAGAVDVVFASMAGLGSMSFALVRGGVASWSLVFGVPAFAVFCVENIFANYILELFQRWPHVLFRFLAFLMIFIALNGGLLLNSAKELIAVFVFTLVMFFGFVFVELQIPHPLAAPDCVFFWTDYIAGVARCTMSVIVVVASCLTFLRSRCDVSDLIPGKCDQGAGPYSSLVNESPKLSENGEGNTDVHIGA